MAEKKEYQKLVETLKKYVNWELKNAELLLEKNRTGALSLPEKVEQTAILFTRKNRLNGQGVLSVIYLEYLNYLKTTTKKERNTFTGLIDKYGRYADALLNVAPDDGDSYSFEHNIKKEALKININRNKRGERRYSDFFNANMLIEDYGDDILFCQDWKKWLIWDGRRWSDKDKLEICFLAKLSIKRMQDKAIEKRNAEESLALMEHAGRSETSRKVDAMVKTASWEKKLWIHPEDFDRENMIFNCANGSIDLTSGRLIPHERKNLITKLSPIDYKPDAECPVWREFLKTIFKKDKNLIQYVQKVFGMSLTGDNSAQAMFILYGKGANGKSTFIGAILDIMGDYGANTPTETLIQKKNDSASNDIARLQGARFVSATEADIGGKLAEAIVKRLTGNDRISARFLYGEFFEFKPTFKLFMATNHKPNVSGMDEAIWRRLKLIPFEVSIKANERDSKLPEKLAKEYEGILAWMVEGCILWQKEGLGDPPAVIEATKQYRYEMSAVESFLQDCCKRDINEMVQASHIYNAYKEWAETNNERIMSNRAFAIRLAESGLDKVRRGPGNFWIGITLNK